MGNPVSSPHTVPKLLQAERNELSTIISVMIHQSWERATGTLRFTWMRLHWPWILIQSCQWSCPWFTCSGWYLRSNFSVNFLTSHQSHHRLTYEGNFWSLISPSTDFGDKFITRDCETRGRWNCCFWRVRSFCAPPAISVNGVLATVLVCSGYFYYKFQKFQRLASSRSWKPDCYKMHRSQCGWTRLLRVSTQTLVWLWKRCVRRNYPVPLAPG